MMKFYTGILTVVVLYSMIVLGAISASAGDKMFFFQEHGAWTIGGAAPQKDVYECSARRIITGKNGDVEINIVQNFGPRTQETYIRFGSNKVLENTYPKESVVPVIINFEKSISRSEAIVYHDKFVVIPNMPTEEFIQILMDGGKIDFIFPVRAYTIGLEGMDEVIGKMTACMAQGNILFDPGTKL